MVVFSTARNLRATMALCSILAVGFGAITLYSNISGGVITGRFLLRGRHVWFGVLAMPGEDRSDTHSVELDYNDRSDEMAVWFSAGFCILAGALGLLKLCVDAYQRRRRNLGGFYETSTSTFWTILSYIPASTAVIAFVMTFASAVYTWQQRLTMQLNTCHWQLGEKADAVFKCTRELAVCEISPYLLKRDTSERARSQRQKACEQLQFSRATMLVLVVALLYLVGSYGAQLYLIKRETRALACIDEKITSARSSSDFCGRRERGRRHSWSSTISSHSVEKAE